MNRKNLERVLWLCVALAVTFLAISYDRSRSTVSVPNDEVVIAPYSANPEALRDVTPEPVIEDTVDIDYSLPLSANPEALRDQNSMSLQPGETWTYSYMTNDVLLREVVVTNDASTVLNFDMSLFYYSADDTIYCPHQTYVVYGPLGTNPEVEVNANSDTFMRLSRWSYAYDMWAYLCGPRVAAPQNFEYFVTNSH